MPSIQRDSAGNQENKSAQGLVSVIIAAIIVAVLMIVAVSILIVSKEGFFDKPQPENENVQEAVTEEATTAETTTVPETTTVQETTTVIVTTTEAPTVAPAHQIDWSYATNTTAYLKNPTGKTRVYLTCGVMSQDHWISGYDPVTIHEVYTDGCCKVSYVTDRGNTNTYLARISDFTFHQRDWTYGTDFVAYLRNPSGKTTVYTSCGVVATDHWISGEDPVTIHEVYTDGCCRVSYITDSGITRTYYAKIYDFVF